MMISAQSKFVLSVYLCGLIAYSAPATAGKWKTVDQNDTVITLKNWPDPEQCVFRMKTSVDYSRDITSAACPLKISRDRAGLFRPRTYLRIQELMPGHFWGGGYPDDFSEHPMFTKAKGRWFKYFKNPVISPGQDTECYNSERCRFRRIKFTVWSFTENSRECQWVFYLPDLGRTDASSGRSDTPYSVEIFTCQTSIPFTKKHILMKPGKVTLVFPGPPLKVEKSVQKPRDTDRSAESGSENSITDRLKALKKLEDSDLISKEEAAAKRKEILKNL